MITKQKFLSESEFQEIYSLIALKTDRDSLMMRLLVETGARESEILALTSKDFEAGMVTLKGLKGSNDRSIPIKEDLYESLLKLCSSKETLLFPISSRRFRYIYREVFGPLGKSARALRHTMGIRLYEKSRNVLLVKQVLGHKALSSTMIYMEYVEGQEKLKEHLRGLF